MDVFFLPVCEKASFSHGTSLSRWGGGVLPVMDYTGSKKAEANTTWNDFKLVYYISAGKTNLLQE